jgi:SET domain-containing protein
MEYRPLPGNLTIKESEIEGLGLFSKGVIAKGEFLGVSHVHDKRFKDDYIRTPLGGFINHSDTPNCELRSTGWGSLYLVTIKEIQPEEEITTKYSLYNLQHKV